MKKGKGFKTVVKIGVNAVKYWWGEGVSNTYFFPEVVHRCTKMFRSFEVYLRASPLP